MKKRSPIVKGQYYAAKYRSKGSGDVVVCRVQSVRTTRNPEDKVYIVSINLLNEKPSTKSFNVFVRRMKRISKSQAKRILATFKKDGKEAAREVAASAPEFHNGREKPEQLVLPIKDHTADVAMLVYNTKKKIEEDVQRRIDELASNLVKLLKQKGAEHGKHVKK